MRSIHHTFDVHLAEKYGIEEAIIINYFQHSIKDQTDEEIAAHFPYLSKDEVRRLIDKLLNLKVL